MKLVLFAAAPFLLLAACSPPASQNTAPAPVQMSSQARTEMDRINAARFTTTLPDTLPTAPATAVPAAPAPGPPQSWRTRHRRRPKQPSWRGVDRVDARHLRHPRRATAITSQQNRLARLRTAHQLGCDRTWSRGSSGRASALPRWAQLTGGTHRQRSRLDHQRRTRPVSRWTKSEA